MDLPEELAGRNVALQDSSGESSAGSEEHGQKLPSSSSRYMSSSTECGRNEKLKDGSGEVSGENQVHIGNCRKKTLVIEGQKSRLNGVL